MTLWPNRTAHFELREGQVIADRYELAGLLGSGTATVVFRARDLLSGDEIAVKVFGANALENPTALKAFKRELAILRDGAHPNVVRIIDFGEVAGTFYVAMELVHGDQLSRTAGDAAGWPQAVVIEIFEQLTGALAWLHSRGVVHGDVRASNIVWNGGALKLMDFGTERDVRQVKLHAPDSGCPYASPERLLGRPLTPTSDLYSAAAVIHHLLVGEPPHTGASLLERAMADAPRLRSRSPDVPDEFAGILERCLNPDPALRPAGAAEILEECRLLRRCADARPSVPVLADWIGEEPLDLNEMTALLLTICRLLREIHDAGLAHADLAPGNIPLTDGRHVEIPTFPAPPPHATLMITEPKYAAPEMLLTHTATDGGAHLQSDIYVLGFVSYEALTGRNALRSHLFGDSGEPETDLFWMRWHADSATRLPPLSDLNPSVPQELSALIQRMIEKEPAARPCSLQEVEHMLNQVQRRFEATEDIELASLSGSAPPLRSGGAATSPETKARKRKRKVLSRVLLLASVLACGGAALWWPEAEIHTGPILAGALRWVEEKAAWARVSIVALLPGPNSTPDPAATIETETGPMVLVPAGNFVMGSSAVPNEAPARTVHLPAFYIDKYEVSNGRYRAFADKTGYRQPAAPSGIRITSRRARIRSSTYPGAMRRRSALPPESACPQRRNGRRRHEARLRPAGIGRTGPLKDSPT